MASARVACAVWLALGALVEPASAQLLAGMYRDALAGDPNVAGAAAQLRAADERVNQARSAFGPTATLSVSTNSNRYNEAPAYKLRRFHANQGQFQVTQPLLRNALYPTLQGARAQVEQAAAALEQVRNEAGLRLLEASFELLKARDALALVGAQRIAAEEQLQAAQRKFRTGNVTVVDVRDAEAKIDTVIAQGIAAQADLELRRQFLAELVGRDLPELLERGLAGERLPAPAANGILEWLADAELHSPQIRQAQQGLLIAQADERKAWQGHAPTADLVYTYSQSSDTGTVTSVFPRRGNLSEVGLNLNVPLFASGATQARVRETVALREKAESDVAAARRLVQLNVRQSFTATLSSASLARGLETATRSLEVALRANQRGYEVGMKINVDVLEAQSKWFESRRELSRARYDAWLNWLRLRAASGQLQDTDVEALDAMLVAEPAIVPRPRSVPRTEPSQ